MRPQFYEDQSTPRPWKIGEDNDVFNKDETFCIAMVCGASNKKPSREALANGKLIILAVNSYAALCAVARAAKYLRLGLEPVPEIQRSGPNGCICGGCGAWVPKGNPEAHDHKNNCPEVQKRSAIFGQREHNTRHGKRMLDEAIAALSKVEETQ